MVSSINYPGSIMGDEEAMVAAKVVMLGTMAIALLVVGIYLPFAFQPSTKNSSSNSSSTTSSVSTTTSTTATSCTSATSSSSSSTTLTNSTSSTSSSSSSTSSLTNGTFSYQPTYPVKIQTVDAVTNKNQNGTEYVTFRVLFENIGPTPIYVAGGCGSGLNSSIQTNSMIQKISGGPLCECAQLMIPIDRGQNHNSITPGCWNGHTYRLTQPGSVTVSLTLNWSTTFQNASETNSTSILARFNFA